MNDYQDKTQLIDLLAIFLFWLQTVKKTALQGNSKAVSF